MLKSFLEILRQLYGYADDTKKNTTDIKVLQTDREASNIVMRQVISDADTDRRLAERDRENLLLRLELAMRDNAQRALPPVSAASQNEIAELRAKIEAQDREIERLKQRVSVLESQK